MHTSRSTLAGTVAACGLLVLAGPAQATPDAGETRSGALTVKVKGLPSAIAGKVRVVGPLADQSPRTWRLSKTTTLRGLPPGDYRLAAKTVLNGTGAELTASPTPQRLRVTAGQASTAKVLYEAPDGEIPGRIKDFNPLCKNYWSQSTHAEYLHADIADSWICVWPDGVWTHLRHDQMADWCPSFFYKGTHLELRGDTVWDWWCRWPG